MTFTAIDFETTGHVPHHPLQPWQIGLVPVTTGALPPTVIGHWLHIPLTRPFNRHAPGRHSRIRPLLAAASPLPDLWPHLSPHLQSRPLVAHNVPTEKTILTTAFPLHTFGPWIDTLTLSRQAWPDLPSHALTDLIDHLNLHLALDEHCPGLGPHDARYDALASALILLHLLRHPNWHRHVRQNYFVDTN